MTGTQHLAEILVVLFLLTALALLGWLKQSDANLTGGTCWDEEVARTMSQ